MNRRARTEPLAEPIHDPDAAREAALKLLERTRRTRVDLERKLADKGFAPAAVADALERLARVGLVDDAEFARAFLAGRWGRKPSGWRSLQMQLRSKGVSEADTLAGRARIEERDGVVDEFATARKLVEQASRRYASLEPRVRQQRLYALLARRGFDGDVIRRALAMREIDAGE